MINVSKYYAISNSNPSNFYLNTILADAPIGLWRFAEASGSSAADSSGNGLTGTYVASPTLGQPGPLNGDSSTAVLLNGSTQWVTVADNILLHTVDIFSIEIWINPTNFSSSMFVFDKGANGYALFINSSTGLVTFAKSGIANIVTSTISLVAGVYSHIVLTKNGSAVHLYINGVDVTGSVSNLTLISVSATLFIGESSGGIDQVVGSMADAAVYGYALSAAQALAHYNAGIDIRASKIPIFRAKFAGVATEYSSHPIKANYQDVVLQDGPSAYYRFGEASGSTATDSSGNSLNGVYNGTFGLGIVGAIVKDANTAVNLKSAAYVSVANNSLIDVADIFTLEAWVFMPALPGGNSHIFDKSTNGPIVNISSSGTIVFGTSGGTIASSTINLSANTWYHIVVTKYTATTHIYVNGVDVTGSVSNITISSNGSAWGIGAVSGGGFTFLTGYMDETAIYKGVALTSARVNAHYDAGQMVFPRDGVSDLMAVTQTPQSPSIAASQVIPEKGQSSIGELDFILEDLADYDSEVLADAPNVYYKLNELKGTSAADSSGNAVNGTYNNGTQFGQVGPINYAADWANNFDGVSQYVSVPNNALIRPGDVFTVEFWVNVSTWTAPPETLFPAFVAKDTNDFIVYIDSTHGFLLSLNKQGVGTIAQSTIAMATGWAHGVVTKNGSAVHIYINGVDVTGSVSNQTIVSASTGMGIGASFNGGSNWLSGAMARVAVYPTALSATRVLAHYNAVVSRNANSLNGAITRLIASGVQGSQVTWSMGFDDIREQDYVQQIMGVVDDYGLTQDITGYQFMVRDPQTLANRQTFNVSATKLSAGITSGSTSLIAANSSAFYTPGSVVGYMRIDSEYIIYGSNTFTGQQIAEQTWASVAFGSTNFVAVANDGSLAYSADGKNWYSSTAPEANNWTSVCWTGTQYIVVGSSGTHRVMTSPDGISWTLQSAASANLWTAVCWSAGLSLAVAVSSDNAIMTSPDGVTWTNRSSIAGSQAWRSIVWSPGDTLLIAMGDAGAIMSSANGTSWTDRSYPGAANGLLSIASNGTVYVAVGGNTASVNAVMTSTDGSTWIPRVASEQNTWTSVCWASGLSLFVAVASSGTHRVMTSPDGITWTNQTAASASAWHGVCYSGTKLVAVGNSGVCMTSTNATSWTSQTIPNDNWQAVCWASGLSLFVAVGAKANVSSVATSPDGVTWTSRTGVNGNLGQWNGVVWAGGISKVVAAGSDSNAHIAMYSTDGITWTASSGALASANCVAWDSTGSILAAATSGAVYSSTDAITWTSRSSQGAQAVCWDSTISAGFVATTSTGVTQNSSNGTSWTTVATAIDFFTSVVWASSLSLFVAVAASGPGNPATSADGITWKSRTAAEANPWTSVAWTGSLLAAVASSGTHQVMKSTDGITWVAETAAAANQWQGIAWGNSTFVAVSSTGGGNRDMLSPDAVTWTVYNSTIAGPLIRGALGSLATSHSAGATIQEIVYINFHPIDIASKILQNTGDKIGCAIPTALVDNTGFAAIKAAMGSKLLMQFIISAPQNAKTFIEQQICQPCGLYFVQRNGQFSLHQMAGTLAAGSGIDTITNDVITMQNGLALLNWSRNFKNTVINSVTVQYDWNGSNYNSSYYTSNATSISKFGEFPIVIQSQGWLTSNPGTLAFIISLGTTLLARYAYGAAAIPMQLFISKFILEAGDVINLNSTILPNPATGSRGVTNQAMEIVSRAINLYDGSVDANLLWVGLTS